MGAGGNLTRGGPPPPLVCPKGQLVPQAELSKETQGSATNRLRGLGQVTSLLWASGSSTAGV